MGLSFCCTLIRENGNSAQSAAPERQELKVPYSLSLSFSPSLSVHTCICIFLPSSFLRQGKLGAKPGDAVRGDKDECKTDMVICHSQ